MGGCTRGLLDHPFFGSVDFVKLGNKLVIPEYRPPSDAVHHNMLDFVPPMKREKPFTGDLSKFSCF
jgi:hypothetical protein